MNYIVKLNDDRLYYLLAVAFITDYLQYIFAPLHYISFICKFCLCIIMLPHFLRLTKNSLVAYIIISYFVFLIFRGLLLNNFYKYLIFDIHIYYSVFFLTFFNSENSYKKYYSQIPQIFSRLLIFSIPIAIVTFYLYGTLNINDLYARSLLGDENSGLDEKIFLAPILIAPLLVPFISEMKRSLKYTILIANSLFLIYGVLTVTRSTIAIGILAFLSLLVQQTRIKKLKLYSIIIFSIIIIFFSIPKKSNSSFLGNKIFYIIARFDKDNDYTSGRDTEVAGLFKEFSGSELLLGRGAGAEQKFGFWKNQFSANEHGINFTHFGFLNLILKGGFILLLIIYGLALYSLFVLYSHGERKYFFVILIYLIAELSHTQFVNYFYVMFLWISIGLALQLSMNKNKKFIIYNSNNDINDINEKSKLKG